MKVMVKIIASNSHSTSEDNLFLQIDRDNAVDETRVAHEHFLVDGNDWQIFQVYWIERGRPNVGKYINIIYLSLLSVRMMGCDRILRIPFTASVRLWALLLKAGPGGQTPSKSAR